MNSKQRKQAEKLKRDVEFTMPLKVQKLHADQEALKRERAELNEWYERAKAQIITLQRRSEEELKESESKSMSDLKNSSEKLGVRESDVRGREKRLRDAAKEFEARMHELEQGKILGEVLLALELEETPEKIALNLRLRYGLAIPEW